MLVQHVMESWHIKGTITVGDDKWPREMPYDGEVVSFGGSISSLGSGAGTSTDVQLRNVTQAKDILSEVGSFEVDSATKIMEGAVVNQANCSFARGDVLTPDVDAIPGGSDSAEAIVEAVVAYFMDDV